MHLNPRTFTRMIPIALMTLVMAVTGGCDGCDSGTPSSDAETGEDVVVEASVDFWAVNGEGTAIGQYEESILLTASDEAEDHLEQPGFQIDFVVQGLNVEDETAVSLSIDGNSVADGLLSVTCIDLPCDLGIGLVLLKGVTISQGTHQVAIAIADGPAVEKSVIVELGTCSVELTPTNENCLTEDADPDSDGFQVSFTVTNPENDCTDAYLQIDSEGGSDTTAPVALNADGIAEIVVTFDGTGADVDGAHAITAHVVDSTSPERLGLTGPVEFTVDNTPPAVQLTQPTTALLSGSDEDEELPGIQVTITGNASGVSVENTEAISLYIDSTLHGQSGIDEAGEFAFPGVTFDQNKVYVVEARAADACGQEAADIRDIPVATGNAQLTLLNPASSGAAFLAKDDADPETSFIHETEFTAFVDPATAGSVLEVSCRAASSNSVHLTVGSLTLTEGTITSDGIYQIPVTVDTVALEGGDALCRASYVGLFSALTPESPATFGIPSPSLGIIVPSTGGLINEPNTQALVLQGDRLEGVTPSVVLVAGINPPDLPTATLTVPAFSLGASSTNLGEALADGASLFDGTYTLHATASDSAGNAAEEDPNSSPVASFTLDRTGPSVQVLSSVEGLSGNDDANDTLPGMQIKLEVSVFDSADGEICAWHGDNPGVNLCKPFEADGDTITFNDFTVQPAVADVHVRAIDAAGNEGTAIISGSYNTASGRTVQILSPAAPAWSNGVSTLSNTVDITVEVLIGISPSSGDDLSIQVNGTDSGAAALETTPGTYLFSDVPLSPGTNQVQALIGSGGADEGASWPLVVNYKMAGPSIALTSPADGSTLNLDSTACAPAAANCHSTIIATTSNVDEGANAELTVNCGGEATLYTAPVEGDQAAFDLTAEPLLHGSTCSLTLSVDDGSGQTADASASVTIDRVRPVIHGFPTPSDAILIESSDENATKPGMQKSVSLEIAGVEAGQTVTLIATDEAGGPLLSQNVVISETIPEDTPSTISIGQLDLPEGIVILRATVEDVAGNAADPRGRTYLVITEAPEVAILTPTNVAATTCISSQECSAGAICLNGACAVGWGSGSNRSFLIQATSVEPGLANVRVCTNMAGSPGAACATSGYTQVTTGDLVSGTTLTIAVPEAADGIHDFIVEAEAFSGSGDWVSSLDNNYPQYRSRSILIDTVAPTAQQITIPSDVLEPAGILNAAEQIGEKTFLVGVTASENGSATLYVDGQPRPPFAVNESEDSYYGESAVTFGVDGEATLQVIVEDEVGNTTDLGSSPETFVTIWTTAPLLQFISPAKSPLVAGDPLDAVLSASPGATVQLFDNGLASGDPTNADENGSVVFAGAIGQGTHALTATATDFANNTTSATTSPTSIFVDTIAPSLSLMAPLSGVYVDEDDANALQGGYQMDVQFAHVGATTWGIGVTGNCASDFTGCSDVAELLSGNISGNNQVPVQTITIPGGTTDYSQIVVTAVDDAGNVATEVANLTIQLSNCALAFSNVPFDGIYNAGDCSSPGCSSLETTANVILTGACAGQVAEVQFLKDGVPDAQLIVPGSLEVSFPLTLNDGDQFAMEAIAVGGGVPPSTGQINVLADFTAPTVNFVAANVDGFDSPGTGASETWGLNADQDGATPGCQWHARIGISDAGPAGGNITGITATATSGNELPIGSFPVTISEFPFTYDAKFLTVGDQTSWTITVVAEDAAGNAGSASFEAETDLLAPSAAALLAIDDGDVNARLPAFPLTWSAPADNADGSGGPVSSYEVRYSPLPIDNEDDFNAACSTDSLLGMGAPPTPAAPGSEETLVIAGPDPRAANTLENGTLCKFSTHTDGSPWHFAVRAFDDAGNGSPISAATTTSSTAAQLNFTRIMVAESLAADTSPFAQYVFAAGDINADGRGDLVVGGRKAHGFCVVYGHPNNPTGTIDEIVIASDSGPNHQCVFLPDSALGSNVTSGDVNGDGIDDLIVTAGGNSNSTPEQVRIHLGESGVGIAATPDLVISGQNMGFSYGSEVSSGGNFDGDTFGGNSVEDILIGSRKENRAYLVPGSASWPATTLDLTNATDRAAFNVVTLELMDGDSASGFGYRAAMLDDILTSDGMGYAEIAVTQQKGTPGMSQVFVIRGRPVSGDTQLAYYLEPTPALGDAANAIWVRADTGVDTFGRQVMSAGDLTGDGKSEVIVNHSKDDRVYIFDGAALDAGAGTIVTVNAGTSVADGIALGSGGSVLEGEYDNISALGNFDGDTQQLGQGTTDIAFGVYSFSEWGMVNLRMNQTPSSASWEGAFPYTDVVVEEPFPMTSPAFFATTVAPIGDFNGDGQPDVLVGNKTTGTPLTDNWATIIY